MWYNISMAWNKALVKYWCERYYELRSYELLPFEHHLTIKGLPVITGSRTSLSPYEETCDLNWEFDKALTKLGGDAKMFREVYLDGGSETKESKVIYDEFCKLLMEGNE